MAGQSAQTLSGLYCGTGKALLSSLLQEPSTHNLKGLDAGGTQLSTAASFKTGKQQGAGWLLHVGSLPLEASGNL